MISSSKLKIKFSMKARKLIFSLVFGIRLMVPAFLSARIPRADSTLANATLEQCIEYALKTQPYINQALIDEQIGERDIKSALSGWLPQINANGSYNHNFK